MKLPFQIRCIFSGAFRPDLVARLIDRFWSIEKIKLGEGGIFENL